jgi:lysophospholipase L1-like esterase
MEGICGSPINHYGEVAMSKTKIIVACDLLITIALLICRGAVAQSSRTNSHWVSDWSTAVQAPADYPGAPPLLTVENQTVRMVVRPTLGGDRLRVRLSNEYGTSALKIGAAHIAVLRQGVAIVPDSDRTLTFGGQASVSIPAGAPMLSDPIELKTTDLTELAITLFLPEKTTGSTTHFLGQHETYVSVPGNFSATVEWTPSAITKSWYWLEGVDVISDAQTSALVAFGDSITDGYGSTIGSYGGWPNQLAKRLESRSQMARIAVINKGISGNRVLHDAAGVSALARLDRDLFALPGVTGVIILESINDIGFPYVKIPAPKASNSPDFAPFADQKVSALDLRVGLLQVIERAHERGIKVYGATLTPFEGVNTYNAEGEAIRQELNQWIRTGGAFDAVLDFDEAVRDPNHLTKMRAEFDCGDHIHPSDAGYKAMAESIDSTLFKYGLTDVKNKP